MSATNTAILVFARGPQTDAFHKGIPGGVKLFQRLTTLTLNKAKRSELPCFLISGREQQGVTFGERLSNAVEDVFSRGIENLIIIGNDTPSLSTQILRETARDLVREKAILGPAPDGGVYLIGLHRSVFSKSWFQALPWQYSSLCDSLLSELRVRTDQSIRLLGYHSDLDSSTDLRILLENTFHSIGEIIQLIRGLINYNVRILQLCSCTTRGTTLPSTITKAHL